MAARKPLVFNGRVEQLSSSDSIDIASITYGGKRHYRGAAPYPFTPAIGDTWSELNAGGLWIEAWTWDGNYWRSILTYEYSFSVTGSNNFSISSFDPAFPLNPGSNILLLNFVLSGVQNTGASATNRWIFTLQRISPPGAVTFIASFDTFTPTVFIGNSWNTVVYPINTLIDVPATSAKTLRVIESRTGTLSKIFSYTIEYQKVRLP